jgi:hypothetical protein
MNRGDALAKDYVQMAIEILKAPPLSSSDQDTILMQKQLRIWALKDVNQYGKVQIEGKLSDYLGPPEKAATAAGQQRWLIASL